MEGSPGARYVADRGSDDQGTSHPGSRAQLIESTRAPELRRPELLGTRGPESRAPWAGHGNEATRVLLRYHGLTQLREKEKE